MGFTWTEIKKWAKERGLDPKKTGGEYKWEDNTYNDINSLVTALFNKISNNKWVEHQKNYEENSGKDS